jgi:hypothetical protein
MLSPGEYFENVNGPVPIGSRAMSAMFSSATMAVPLKAPRFASRPGVGCVRVISTVRSSAP